MIQAAQPSGRGAVLPGDGGKGLCAVGFIRDAPGVVQRGSNHVISLLLGRGHGTLPVADILLRRGNPLCTLQLAPVDIDGHLVLVVCDDPRAAGVLPEQVETLYLAGGFGSCLNPKSAGAIGLIPPRLAPRAEGLGNAALLGAAAILLREEGRRRALAISKEAVHLELSQDPDFMERYVEHMMF